MIAVFHRQWKSLAHSWFFYGFLTAFFLALGILIATFHVSYQYANFEYILSYLTIAFAFLFPLLSISVFYEERRKGAEAFVRALPISAERLVLGKMLALLSLLGVLSVILLLIPMLLGVWGGVYYPSAYMAILGFFLFGVAILAIDSFLAVLFRNPWVAASVSYAVTGGLLALSYASLLLSPSVGRILSRYSFFGSFTPFTFGIFDFGAIVLYLSAGALFGILTILFAKRIWKE